MMKTEDADRSTNQLAHRRRRNFENSKSQCLGKRDKSFSGRIDPKAVNICSVINERDEYYTTSSCAGRCFLYQGPGRKATTEFQRWRISHDKIADSQRYFDLSTIDSDPSGGADPIRSIGQFEHAEKVRQSQEGEGIESEEAILMEQSSSQQSPSASEQKQSILWLRFEPFILHVACRSLSATSALMTAARPAFKNVGLTTWKDGDSSNSNFSKYLVAVWGDEGLDMPLSTPDGSNPFAGHHEWLADLVNERHQRNWDKIDRFVQSVRDMPLSVEEDDTCDNVDDATNLKVPKHFDVIGDIAVLNGVPPGDEEDQKRIGEAILNKNKAIKVWLWIGRSYVTYCSNTAIRDRYSSFFFFFWLLYLDEHSACGCPSIQLGRNGTCTGHHWIPALGWHCYSFTTYDFSHGVWNQVHRGLESHLF